jgi:hypothetical protein
MIALMAPKQRADEAWQLREAVFDLWRLARDVPAANKPGSGSGLSEVGKVRDMAEHFRTEVRGELNIPEEIQD